MILKSCEKPKESVNEPTNVLVVEFRGAVFDDGTMWKISCSWKVTQEEVIYKYHARNVVSILPLQYPKRLWSYWEWIDLYKQKIERVNNLH